MVVCDDKVANVWVAHIIPIVLIAIVSYSSWAVVSQVCVDYLLRPSTTYKHGTRPAAAVAILTVYFLLLLPMAITYFRLLGTVLLNPGFVPRGPRWYQQKAEQASKNKVQPTSNTEAVKEKGEQAWTRRDERPPSAPWRMDGIDPTAFGQRPLGPAPGLENFHSKEVFVCEADGRPIWCSTCLNWKPDRAHHCREVGRCVEKMDHFCPWVGGIVSETSFKFFIQFVSYAAVYCVFTLIVMAIFVAEKMKAPNPTMNGLNVHWILTLAFAGLFGLFTIGMSGSSIDLALKNCTTVENLTRKTKIWQLAVHSTKLDGPQQGSTPVAPGAFRQTYPAIPASAGSPSIEGTHEEIAKPSPPSRSFAVLRTQPGENPWNLGPYGNWKSVMGDHLLDWFLPLKHSPCCDHSHGEAAFETGPVVSRLRHENGLASETSSPAPISGHRRSHLRTSIVETKPEHDRMKEKPEGS